MAIFIGCYGLVFIGIWGADLLSAKGRLLKFEDVNVLETAAARGVVALVRLTVMMMIA